MLLCTDLPDLMKGSKDSDSGENGDVPTNNDDDDDDEDMDIGGGGSGATATRYRVDHRNPDGFHKQPITFGHSKGFK